MKEYNRYTMSTIMKGAWELARRGAKKFGGSAREYFAESLKKVWARVKKMVYVPTWFINKKSTVGMFTKMERALKVKETEKAVYVSLLVDGECMWVPKSVLLHTIHPA